MLEQKIHYGDRQISYKVVFSSKQQSRISIHVHPNGTVQVDTPPDTSLLEVKSAVHKRARWINDHIENILRQTYNVLPREYVSGESHFYIGRRYLLKVKKSKPSVKLIRGQIQVSTPNRKPNQVKALLWDWYLAHAECYFQNRLDEIYSEIRWLNQSPEWRLREMKKQWGSCSPKGVISLNPHLIKAPRQCIDYVIIHELCHKKIHNHGKKYYKLLNYTLPDWEAIKIRLDSMSELILNS